MKREKKMNFVTVNGGNKTQRKVAEITVHQMIAELLPRFRTLILKLQLKNSKSDRRCDWLVWYDKMTIVLLKLRSIKIWVSLNW